MKARFGPAGNGNKFAELGYKSSSDIPLFLAEAGLDAYEYQCGRGVRLAESTAKILKAAAEEKDIAFSVHAPYFISMSGTEEAKRLKSIDYILQSAAAVKALGGNRVVLHTGSCGKIPRAEALSLAEDTMRRAIPALDEADLGDVHICPETMGKINQLGDLNEVVSLCELDERLIPCIDFGHLNARTSGGIKGESDYENILQTVENRLGNDRMRRMHIHFSKIEYTAGGEKKHLTFADTVFGPRFEPLIDVLVKKNCAPVIICESAGTQAEDARTMKDYYDSVV